MEYFSEKSVLLEEPDDNKRIWRYMTLPKFLIMLKKDSLFLPRVSKLIDKFEGAPAKLRYKTAMDESMDESYPREKHDKEKFLYLVSCWHLNEDSESDALWKIYGKENGIAIVTTYGKLKAFFHCIEMDQFIGKVKYEGSPSFKTRESLFYKK